MASGSLNGQASSINEQQKQQHATKRSSRLYVSPSVFRTYYPHTIIFKVRVVKMPVQKVNAYSVTCLRPISHHHGLGSWLAAEDNEMKADELSL